MPVKRTKEGGFDVSVCVGRQRLHRRLAPGTSASDAKQLEADLRTSLTRNREPVIPGDPGLTEAMAAYLEHAKTLRSPDTAKFHALRIGKWVSLYRASEARRAAAHIVRDLSQAYKPATVNKSLGTLKKGLGILWETGRTIPNYGDHVDLLEENNKRTVYLSMQQVKNITDQASENTRAAVWISMLTGCRRGEVCKVQAEDVQKNTIRVPAGNTKSLRYREVPITPALRPWLKYLPLPIGYEGVKSGFRRAREKAGVPHVHFHDLRHSCATLLLGMKVPLHVIRDILGHSSISVTERYAHAEVGPQREGLAKLGALHQRVHQAPKKKARHA